MVIIGCLIGVLVDALESGVQSPGVKPLKDVEQIAVQKPSKPTFNPTKSNNKVNKASLET